MTCIENGLYPVSVSIGNAFSSCFEAYVQKYRLGTERSLYQSKDSFCSDS